MEVLNLAADFSVDWHEEESLTPLAAAAWGGRLVVVRSLLAKGADVAVRVHKGDFRGFGALELAAHRGAPGCVEALLAAGAQYDPSLNIFQRLLREWSADDDFQRRSPNQESLEAMAAVLARGSVEPSLERDPHVRIARRLGHAASKVDIDAAREVLDRRTTKAAPPPPGERAAAIAKRSLSTDDKRALLLSFASTGDVKGLAAVGLKGAPRLFGRSLEGGDTPLHRAAKAGSTAAVDALLAAGFDPNFFTAFDGQVPPRSPLTDAFSAGHGDVARRLAEGGAVAAMPRKLRPSFQDAIDASEVPSCIDSCAHPLVDCDDLETLAWFLARPETQRHALLLADAIERDDLERVRVLLDGGVPVNDKLGKFSPLDVAWALERRAIAELLVSRGATSKRKPPRPGPTAEERLQDLRQDKLAPDTSLLSEELIHRRLDAGLDPAVELDIALRRRADVAARFLSHPSVKPDLVLPQMGSPMHGAATLGDAAMLRGLIARGGDPSARAASSGENPKVKRGQTPLHVLSSLSSDHLPFEALDVLLAAGAAVNALDDAGQTPLDVVSFRAIRARLRAAGAMSGREIAEAEALPEEG